jgi:hypothetical protein
VGGCACARRPTVGRAVNRSFQAEPEASGELEEAAIWYENQRLASAWKFLRRSMPLLNESPGGRGPCQRARTTSWRRPPPGRLHPRQLHPTPGRRLPQGIRPHSYSRLLNSQQRRIRKGPAGEVHVRDFATDRSSEPAIRVGVDKPPLRAATPSDDRSTASTSGGVRIS